MRVAIVSPPPDAVLVDKAGWLHVCFVEAGHDAFRCHRLAEVVAADAECDLLVFDQKGAGLCHHKLVEASRSRRAVWVQWWRDLIDYEPDTPLARQPYVATFHKWMAAADVCFVQESARIDDFAALGIKARWIGQACPADMPECRHVRHPAWDVLVLGVPSYRQRREDARKLVDAGYSVAWATLPCGDQIPQGCTPLDWRQPFDLPSLVSNCGIVLGVDCRTDVPGYTSDRTPLACGMGACYVARTNRERTMPQDDLAARCYAGHDELLDTVALLFRDVDLRRQLGKESRAIVMANHTYRHLAERIVRQAVSAA